MIFVFQLIQADLYMQYILEFTTTLKNSLIENSTFFFTICSSKFAIYLSLSFCIQKSYVFEFNENYLKSSRQDIFGNTVLYIR